MSIHALTSASDIANELLKRIGPLGFRMAIRFASYPGSEPNALEVNVFRVPDRSRTKVEESLWDSVISAERSLGFKHTLAFVHGPDVSEEYEAAVTASAIASWAPDS